MNHKSREEIEISISAMSDQQLQDEMKLARKKAAILQAFAARAKSELRKRNK